MKDLPSAYMICPKTHTRHVYRTRENVEFHINKMNLTPQRLAEHVGQERDRLDLCGTDIRHLAGRWIGAGVDPFREHALFRHAGHSYRCEEQRYSFSQYKRNKRAKNMKSEKAKKVVEETSFRNNF